ncbi:MAG: hypothetical protein ACOYOL_12840 [Chthoniobacterales bacterium]
MRELVVPTAHVPTAPVMTMEDVRTSSRLGFALIFAKEITEPTIAEPRAAVVPVEDEQASAPTSTPEPVATEEELALAWLRENPNFQPQTVKLLQPRMSAHWEIRDQHLYLLGVSNPWEVVGSVSIFADWVTQTRQIPYCKDDSQEDDCVFWPAPPTYQKTAVVKVRKGVVVNAKVRNGVRTLTPYAYSPAPRRRRECQGPVGEHPVGGVPRRHRLPADDRRGSSQDADATLPATENLKRL